MPAGARPAIKPVVLGCAGLTLTDEERSLFAAQNPFGFIVFRRNCQSPAQLRALVDDFRACVGRANAPVLIDEEGGRVARLRAPEWREFPAASHYQYMNSPVETAHAAGRLMGAQCLASGIDVNCAPMLDLGCAISHAGVIGDRVFGNDPALITQLAGAYAKGLMEAGVLPIMKHIPGHGRATVDSHLELPVVTASYDELAQDFAPFKALNLPLAMSAHVQYTALDAENPATLSAKIIGDIIRGEIGFSGLLFADTLEMEALSGTLAQRAQRAFAAGIDVALYSTGDMDGNAEILQAAPAMTDEALVKWSRAKAQLPQLSGASGGHFAAFDEAAYDALRAEAAKTAAKLAENGRIAGDSLVAQL